MKWETLSPTQRYHVIYELREHIKQAEAFSDYDVSSWNKLTLIEEAYSTGYNCFVAGWPSSKNTQGSCQSPEKMNGSYAHYINCPEKELLCNPALFGDGLCIAFNTSKEKNSAYDQCEKAFGTQGRLFSEVLNEVNVTEFNELLSTVHTACNGKITASMDALCQKLKRKLQYFVPDESPAHEKAAILSLSEEDPEEISSVLLKLQSEIEDDLNEFKRVCTTIIQEKAQFCKNLAIRIKKSRDLLLKVTTHLESKVNEDCAHCSTEVKNSVINPTAIPNLDALQCTEADMKTKNESCEKEVLCSIASSVMTGFVEIADLLLEKPHGCFSSQNSCISNFVSALIDTVVSLVTGIWDALGMAGDWVGNKISNFWHTVRGVESKTADAQNIINQMSDEDLKSVKSNPIQWIKNLTTNIWRGIDLWMKEDIYCEQWDGIPRASKCVRPMKGFDCISCHTKIAGTCSAGGAIIGQLVPAFLTGGAVNLVARGAEGAKVFAKFIQTSKSYEKMASQVEKLSNVRAIALMVKPVQVTASALTASTKYVSQATRLKARALIESGKQTLNTPLFKVTLKALDKAATHTGLRAVAELNNTFYRSGYKFVDRVAEKTIAKIGSNNQAMMKTVTLSELQEGNKALLAKREELSPRMKEIADAYAKGAEIKKLQSELRTIHQASRPEDTVRMAEIEAELSVLNTELRGINNSFVTNMQKEYIKNGIPASIVTNTEGEMMLEFNFSNRVSSKHAYNFYRQVQKTFGIKTISLSLMDNAELGAGGFFNGHTSRMEVGPQQALQVLDDYVNSISKHETRHSMFASKRRAGKPSIFHTSFGANPKSKLLNTHKVYDQYMSVEEIYTFSTDLETLGSLFTSERASDLSRRVGLMNQISNESRTLILITEAARELSGRMVSSLEKMTQGKISLPMQIKPNPNGTFKLLTQDEFGRIAILEFVSPAEIKLLDRMTQANSVYGNAMNQHINRVLADSGINQAEFSARFPTRLTSSEKIFMKKTIDDFNQSPEGMALNKRIQESIYPVLEAAKQRFKDIGKLARIQAEETIKMDQLLKAYANLKIGGRPEQLEALRQQMFKIGKNVKEDYKGFALKQSRPDKVRNE